MTPITIQKIPSAVPLRRKISPFAVPIPKYSSSKVAARPAMTLKTPPSIIMMAANATHVAHVEAFTLLLESVWLTSVSLGFGRLAGVNVV